MEMSRARCTARFARIVALVVGVSVTSAWSAQHTVTAHRPVADAAKAIELLYGIQVTYEDPFYRAADLDDMAAPASQAGAASAAARRPLMAPRRMSLTYQHADSNARASAQARQTSAVDAIGSVVAQYASLKGGPSFATVQTGKIIHIVPIAEPAIETVARPTTPLLDQLVTLEPSAARTALDVLGDIARQIKAPFGHRFVVGAVQTAALAQHMTTISAYDEPARAVMARLLLELPAPVSWQLLYDPQVKWHVWNFHQLLTSPTNSGVSR
jgi:hypothetical protein